MIAKHLVACLFASALVAAPAMAQTSPPATAPQGSTAAGTTAGGAQTGGMMAAGQQAGQRMAPMAQPGPDQVLGSDLRGTRVYGANNENIGSIDDILLDRNGQVVAVILGVGGFLGIGQKDVAIPFQALDIVGDRRAAWMNRGAAGPATTGAVGTGTTTTGATSPGAVGTAGTVAPGAGATAAATTTGTVNPDRVVLRGMTKADLEAAPEFRSDGRRADAARTGAAPGAGTGAVAPGAPGAAGTAPATAPRQ